MRQLAGGICPSLLGFASLLLLCEIIIVGVGSTFSSSSTVDKMEKRFFTHTFLSNVADTNARFFHST